MDMMTMGTEEVTDTIIDTDIIKKTAPRKSGFYKFNSDDYLFSIDFMRL